MVRHVMKKANRVLGCKITEVGGFYFKEKIRGGDPWTDLNDKRKHVTGVGERLFWAEKSTYRVVTLGLKKSVA